MMKTVLSIPGAQRASKLALVAVASLTAIGATLATPSPAPASSSIVASGFHYNYDFNGDGRADHRTFWFYAIEHADGSVSGQARLSILVDDLDQDGLPDVEPFLVRVRLQIRGAALYSDNEAIISAIVTSHNYPVPCDDPVLSGYSVDTQVAWAVKDNGYGSELDQISPTLTWDCIPFLGSDYGVDDSVSFAQWAVDQGFGPFLGSFLTDIDFGNMYLL